MICEAAGCETEAVERAPHGMCARHWSLVPHPMRVEVFDLWDPGEERLRVRFLAAREAVVMAAEGREAELAELAEAEAVEGGGAMPWAR